MARYLMFEYVQNYTLDEQIRCVASYSFRNTFSSLGSVGSFGLMVIVCISRFEPLDPILS